MFMLSMYKLTLYYVALHVNTYYYQI